MLVSHQHKFIFVKTRKTAGSSVQASLERHMGPNDIVTLMGSSFIPGYKPRRYKWLLDRVPGEAKTRIEHAAAIDLKVWLEEKWPSIWSDYLTFTIERNPWDKMVSEYWWRKSWPPNKVGEFDDWLIKRSVVIGHSTDMYTDNDGKLMVDQVIQWKTLQFSYDLLCKDLGLPSNVLPRIKAKPRTKDEEKRHYSLYYTDETRDFVATRFGSLIDMWGYEFEDKR